MILSKQTSNEMENMAKSFANHIGSDDPEYIEIIKNKFLKEMTILIKNEVELQLNNILNSKKEVENENKKSRS